MKPEKRFKRLCLLAEALAIEEEYFRQQDSVYEIQFRVDFALERIFLSQNTATSASRDKNKIVKDLKAPRVAKRSLKRLHRALARETHPDRHGESSRKEFMNVQTAYEEADVSSLLTAAVKHDISVSLDETDTDQLERQIEEQAKMLKTKRACLRWVWCTSDKSIEIRQQIRSAMSIDQIEFETWLNKTDPEDT